MKTIYVASKNKHKIREMGQILAGLDFDVKGLDEFSDYVSPEETGLTFMENARIKAMALKEYLMEHGLQIERDKIYIIGEDSGLECEDLNGLPGVKSSRFAGEDATDEDNNKKLVEMFNTVTHLSRAAQYVCAMTLILPDKTTEEFEETCPGHIVLVPQGSHGFGYDPHFYLEEYSKTMAEVTPDEKNKISHRGKALRRLVEKLG